MDDSATTWDPGEFQRLFHLTTKLVPSVDWLRELVKNAAEVVAALRAYSTYLGGKPYSDGVRTSRSDDPNVPGDSVPWVDTYGRLEVMARRLECQLNPECRPREDRRKFIFEMVGWGEHEPALWEALGWVRDYLCDLQDIFDWKNHIAGTPVLYGITRQRAKRSEHDCAVFIKIKPNSFVWPQVPTDTVNGMDQSVETLRRIVEDEDRQRHTLTEPMTIQVLAKYFGVNRNKMANMLREMPGVEIAGGMHRVPVSKMPPKYLTEKGLPVK
jgi:hypothetical protein